MARRKVKVQVEGGTNKAIRARLAQIAQAHPRHVLTVAAVRADASNPDSPIHRKLQWDDSRAAAKWRDHQIRELIASVHVRVTVEGVPTQVRAWVSVAEAEGGRAYHERQTTSADVLASAAEDMTHELTGFIHRWESMPNFWAVVDTVLGAARAAKAA